MEIIYKTLGELTPYENNPRHNDEAVELVKNSIEKFGFKVPIVIDKNGVIVAGHTRYKASMELDLAQVPCIVADDLTDEEIRAFRLADNKTAEAATWDLGMLDEELATIGFDMSQFGFDGDDFGLEEEEKYTEKTDIPQYEPSGVDWSVWELYDDEKTRQLTNEIEQANIDPEIKKFLIKAACRHTVFNYKRIADFYTKASEEVQDLMEKSALVIIDYEDAIRNGYVKLNMLVGGFAS